jgi:hypothetical protein
VSLSVVQGGLRVVRNDAGLAPGAVLDVAPCQTFGPQRLWAKLRSPPRLLIPKAKASFDARSFRIRFYTHVQSFSICERMSQKTRPPESQACCANHRRRIAS